MMSLTSYFLLYPSYLFFFFFLLTVCPTIIPRCQWGAEAFRGTPTQLSLPLPYYFIHHTYSPSKPCLTFDQCASNMRAMQSYHQNTNGWADIGYRYNSPLKTKHMISIIYIFNRHKVLLCWFGSVLQLCGRRGWQHLRRPWVELARGSHWGLQLPGLWSLLHWRLHEYSAIPKYCGPRKVPACKLCRR